MSNTKDIVFFYSPDDPHTGFLSQWYPSPFKCHGVQYTGAEQYMMVRKAELFGDYDMAHYILDATEPAEQRRLGRQVRHFKEYEWRDIRFSIVCAANRLKFLEHPDLRARLCSLQGELVHASPRDAIWGIGMSVEEAQVLPEYEWGLNLLGDALMKVRHEFWVRNAVSPPPPSV